ncbi:Twine-like protein [Euroglyphus maynei]|uniref:protein-tyrosine-phosphatase n=1 Tax=Euroglyphus maynei TaxID=6958 RepID=A0A1Y3BGS5_EURMA|nr:Twine-like protein [Euroglyphus maynei]
MPKEADGLISGNDGDESINDKRDILIFHCEFSSERGPSLYRFLRNKDRVKNSRVYPNLHYPEIYLLDGGYKEFFQNYSNLCEPCSYQPMHSKNHEEDLKKFRTICKSLDYKYSTRKRNLRL